MATSQLMSQLKSLSPFVLTKANFALQSDAVTRLNAHTFSVKGTEQTHMVYAGMDVTGDVSFVRCTCANSRYCRDWAQCYHGAAVMATIAFS